MFRGPEIIYYILPKGEIEKIVNRLSNMGYHEVEPENPYWIEKGTTIERIQMVGELCL